MRAVEQSGSVILITDADGNIEYVNPQFTRSTGFALDEVQGRNPRVLKSGAQSREEYDQLWTTVLSGEDWHGTLQNRRKDGTLYWVAAVISPLTDSSGRITHLVGVQEDITDRMAAENELRLFRALIDRSTDAIEVIDPDTGRFLDVNERGCAVLGYTRDEFLALSVPDVDPTVDPSLLAADGEGLRRFAGATWEGVRRRKDGTTFPVEVNVSLVHSGRDYLVAVARDISERQASEAALERSEQEYRALVEQAMSGIYKTTREGKILRANPALVSMLGYASEGELRALDSIAEVYRHPEQRAEVLEGFRRGRESVVELKTRDGGIRTARISGRPREEADGRIVFEGMIQDITDQTALEEQFHQSQKLEALGQLAGGVAHDFNNILSVIMVEAQLGLRRIEDDDPMWERLTEIRAAGERATELTRQLLAFSRKQVTKPVVMNLNALVADISSMLSRLIAEDIDLAITAEEGLGNVLADRGQMEQILTNLVVNARDAMPHGGRLTIRTRTMTPDGALRRAHAELSATPYAVLEVQDTGEGIGPDLRSRIFEPFFTTKRPGKGTGLGLSTVYGIVQKLKGHIEVESEVGVGTTMRVYLPVVPEAESVEAIAAGSRPLPGGHETVLIAEDDHRLRRIARQLLEEQGYTVLAAEDGGRALQLLDTHEGEIHLLLTDVVMPNMGGRELAERIRKRRPDIKLLFMSGHSDEDRMTTRGATYFEKPFTAESLTAAVREALEQEASSSRGP